MFYVRRFGGFVGFASLAASLAITYLLKPFLENRVSDHWHLLIVPAGLVTWGLLFCALYVLNIGVIRFGSRAELDPNLKRRWREFFESAEMPRQIEDFVDRTAYLQQCISMPSLVKDVVTDLLANYRSEHDALQTALDKYSAGNNLDAFVKVLTSQWTVPTEFVRQPPRLIDDPIHGCITLDSDLSTLIAQPIVQRLGRVKQLSFSYTHFDWIRGDQVLPVWLLTLSPCRFRIISQEQVTQNENLNQTRSMIVGGLRPPRAETTESEPNHVAARIGRLIPTTLTPPKPSWRLLVPKSVDPLGQRRRTFVLLFSLGYPELWLPETYEAALARPLEEVFEDPM